MKRTSRCALALGLILPSGVVSSIPGCSSNNCLRAVSALAFTTRAGLDDCSSYLQLTVIPATSTFTSTVTSIETYLVTPTQTETITITQISTVATETDLVIETVREDSATAVESVAPVKRHNRRQQTISGTAIPAYASPCSGAVKYSSACSCLGVVPGTVTVTAPSTTVTVTTVSTSTASVQAVTVTATETDVISVTATSFITSTTILAESSTSTSTSTTTASSTSSTPVCSGGSFTVTTPTGDKFYGVFDTTQPGMPYVARWAPTLPIGVGGRWSIDSTAATVALAGGNTLVIYGSGYHMYLEYATGLLKMDGTNRISSYVKAGTGGYVLVDVDANTQTVSLSAAGNSVPWSCSKVAYLTNSDQTPPVSTGCVVELGIAACVS